MNDDDAVVSEPASDNKAARSWADRNPKLSILLIAGVFYIILFGMCGVVAALLLWG